MKVTVLSGGEVIFQGDVRKADGLVVRVDDGKAFAQFEFDAKKLHVTADGGKPVGGWETELIVPRVKEPKT